MLTARSLAFFLQGQRLERKNHYLTIAPPPRLRFLTQPLEQHQHLIRLALGEQHPRQDKVLALSEVARLILHTQPTLGAPTGGILNLALGDQQPRSLHPHREENIDGRIRHESLGLPYCLQGAGLVAQRLPDPGQSSQARD